MKHRLTALAAAAAVALTTAFAAPATAKSKTEDELWKYILGAAAVGILLNEASRDNDRRAFRPGHRQDWNRSDGRFRRFIPSQCLLSLRTAGGRRDVVSAGCLADFGLDRGLPQSCALRVRTQYGPRTVYGETCLERNGYRIGQARPGRP